MRWFVSDDGGSGHIYERYADSDAVPTHLGNFALVEKADFSLWVSHPRPQGSHWVGWGKCLAPSEPWLGTVARVRGEGSTRAGS